MLSYRNEETKEGLPAFAILFEVLTSYKDPWMGGKIIMSRKLKS
jgi:hypothetical protein